MKIMSLNVNQFQVLRLSEGCWAKEIIALVKGFLFGNPDGVVFLYEVPERFCESGEFAKAMSTYKIEIPDRKNNNAPFFRTAAIIGKGKEKRDECKWEKRVGFSVGEDGRDQWNRYIELSYKDSELYLLGVHAPCGKPKFFARLKKYAHQNKNKPFIIVGDLNVHEKEPSIYLDQIHEIVNLGYSTEIKDGEITYFPNGHTIDHVLVSPELKDKTTAYVIPQEILELSDHAVIIVDVQI